MGAESAATSRVAARPASEMLLMKGVDRHSEGTKPKMLCEIFCIKFH